MLSNAKVKKLEKKIEALEEEVAAEKAAHQETKIAVSERRETRECEFDEELRSVQDWFAGDIAEKEADLDAVVGQCEKLVLCLTSSTEVLQAASAEINIHRDAAKDATRALDAVGSLSSALRTLLIDRTPAIDATLAAIDEALDEASLAANRSFAAGDDLDFTVREELENLKEELARLDGEDEGNDCEDEGNDCSCDECAEGLTGNTDGIEDAEFTIYAEPASAVEIDADVMSDAEKRFFGAGGL